MLSWIHSVCLKCKEHIWFSVQQFTTGSKMNFFFSKISARLSDHEAEVSTKFVDQVEALKQVIVLNAWVCCAFGNVSLNCSHNPPMLTISEFDNSVELGC